MLKSVKGEIVSQRKRQEDRQFDGKSVERMRDNDSGPWLTHAETNFGTPISSRTSNKDTFSGSSYSNDSTLLSVKTSMLYFHSCISAIHEPLKV